MKGKRDSQEQGCNTKSKLIRLREDKTQGAVPKRESHILNVNTSQNLQKRLENSRDLKKHHKFKKFVSLFLSLFLTSMIRKRY